MNLKQCNIDQLEELALAVSELDSPLYGKQLSSQEVCELTTCPGREEAVQGIVSWLLGPNSSTGENVRPFLVVISIADAIFVWQVYLVLL